MVTSFKEKKDKRISSWIIAKFRRYAGSKRTTIEYINVISHSKNTINDELSCFFQIFVRVKNSTREFKG